MITETSTEEIARIFTGRSVGYLVGSILGGLLFDRFNQDCMLSLALLLTAVGTAMAPWSPHYLAMMALFGTQGLSMGFLDTGELIKGSRSGIRMGLLWAFSVHFQYTTEVGKGVQTICLES